MILADTGLRLVRRLLIRTAAASFGFALVVGACTASPGPRAGPSASPSLRLQVSLASFELPTPVEREVAVAQRGLIYLAGGLDSAGKSVNGVLSLDPAAGRVAQMGTIPQPFHDAAGAVIGHRLVVFGGGSSVSTDAVQAFDLATGTGSVIGHLPRPLSDLAAGTVAGTVYLVGGYDGTAPQRQVYSTRDGVHFRPVGTLPAGLRYPAVATLGGRVLIAGGVSAVGAVSTVYEFDPRTRLVRLLGHLPHPAAHAAAVTLAGNVYVIGGRDVAGRTVGSVSEIDPGRRIVRSLASLARPVADAGAVSLGSESWLVGGWRGSALAQILHASLVPVAPSPSSRSGLAAGHSGYLRPFAGLLLIADRETNRLLVVNRQAAVVWQDPRLGVQSAVGFYFPDNAF